MNFARQTDILDPSDFNWPVNLIGLGGIGSAAALTLVKLGVNEFRLADPDTVEDINVPNQLLYSDTDVGDSKYQATRDALARITKVNVSYLAGEVTADTELAGIVISGVDSMKSRHAIWDAVKWSTEIPLYMDGRLGGEILELYTVRPCQLEDVERYEKSLWSDEEASELPCAARAIIHPAVVLSGLIAGQLTRWTRNESYYSKLTFDLKTMTFITEGQIVPG